MTPKTLGVLLGAAALVAAASFALGRAKHTEPGGSQAKEERGKAEVSEAPPHEATQDELPRDDEVERAVEPVVVQHESDEESQLEVAEAMEEVQRPPTVRELHMPVIRAIRGDHPSPEARKDAMLSALRESGPTRDVWANRGAEVFQKWEGLLPRELSQAMLPQTVACYQAGCEVAVRFASREDAEKSAEAFRQLQDPSSELHGGRIQTPAAEVGGGAYEASWIMLRPEGS